MSYTHRTTGRCQCVRQSEDHQTVRLVHLKLQPLFVQDFLFFAVLKRYDDADIRKIKELSQHGAAYCRIHNRPEPLKQFTTNHQIFYQLFPNNAAQVSAASVVGNVPIVTQQSAVQPLTPQSALQTVAQTPSMGPLNTHSFEGDALSSYYNPPHPNDTLPAYTASPTAQQTASPRPHHQTGMETTGALNSRAPTKPTEKGYEAVVSTPQLQPAAINGYTPRVRFATGNAANIA